jgi:hypothetical protein
MSNIETTKKKRLKRNEKITSSSASSMAPPGTARGDQIGAVGNGEHICAGFGGVLTVAATGSLVIGPDTTVLEGDDMGKATGVGDVGLEGAVVDDEAGVVAGDVDSFNEGD